MLAREAGDGVIGQASESTDGDHGRGLTRCHADGKSKKLREKNRYRPIMSTKKFVSNWLVGKGCLLPLLETMGFIDGMEIPRQEGQYNTKQARMDPFTTAACFGKRYDPTNVYMLPVRSAP